MKSTTSILFAILGSAVLVPSYALADAAASGTSGATTPAYGALPLGTMTVPPKDKAPLRVPKIESVDGFVVGDPPKAQLRDGKITNVVVFANEADAKDFNAGKSSVLFGRNAVENVCFARRSQRGFADEESSTEWAFDMEPTSRISAPWKPAPMPPPLAKGAKPPAKPANAKPVGPTLGEMEVTAIHQERFVQDGTKARVEMIDAWVDPVTHGVRLIARSTLALERIGTAPSGVTLYAARGDKALHVVARREKVIDAPDHPPTSSRDFRLLNATRMPLIVQKSDGQTDASRCGFAHVSLKTLKGASEMATFETQAILIDAAPPKPAEKSDDTSEALKGALPAAKEEEEPVRLRPLRATVSSTWGSRDKEPVISVSFGWAGRERQM